MDNITELIRSTLEKVKVKIQEKMMADHRSASGRSSASLTVEVNGATGSIFGNYSLLTLEHGRGAGKVPMNFTDIIKDWIKAKGISVTPIYSTRQSDISPEERGLNSLSGAIAYTIMKKGTRLHRMGGNLDIYTSALEEALEELGEKITFGLGEQVLNINNRIE